MKYVFNPRNLQINPVTEMTLVDSTLRDKVVSSELYALVCKGKVSIADIAAMFAVGKSPEILVKNHAAIKDSPLAKAPTAPVTLPPEDPGKKEGKKEGEGEGDEGEKTDANSAFDGKSLCNKKAPELLVIATTIKCPELEDPNFAPIRQNLIKAIMAKAEAAQAPKALEAPAAPVGTTAGATADASSGGTSAGKPE